MFHKISFALAMGLCALPVSANSAEETPTAATPAQQFSAITSLVGKWDVEGNDVLKIHFEATAGGSVIVEKWMAGDRMHSLTIYHMDGDRLLATHYCPQGNQPRLAAGLSLDGGIRLTFQDATDLDSKESYQHDLHLSVKEDGSLIRSETYWGPEGAGDESSLMLTRAAG
ncbi:hypothetical protein [Pontixanthobacter aquaemixtae]|uniref:DUF1579 domain-containing protein n=1 Tax=Pontixanthobacter aquaemixtae TaxID=1958940 RepID=A0A844ZTT1_9SPHN|nr:hypothetical protein [Pontixanthobacter aquaemixtae]MXO90702.1 hypothetical protein [Pontixanthobacter aquaemixtae]